MWPIRLTWVKSARPRHRATWDRFRARCPAARHARSPACSRRPRALAARSSRSCRRRRACSRPRPACPARPRAWAPGCARSVSAVPPGGKVAIRLDRCPWSASRGLPSRGRGGELERAQSRRRQAARTVRRFIFTASAPPRSSSKAARIAGMPQQCICQPGATAGQQNGGGMMRRAIVGLMLMATALVVAALPAGPGPGAAQQPHRTVLFLRAAGEEGVAGRGEHLHHDHGAGAAPPAVSLPRHAAGRASGCRTRWARACWSRRTG